MQLESHLAVQLAVPFVVFVVMTIVGTELTPNDFRRVGRHPRIVATATLAQLVVLPAASAAVILALRPDSMLTAGLVLLAACPAGAAANIYTYLAGANLALSVTLTAVSSLLAVATLPLIASTGLTLLLTDTQRVEVPILAVAEQLVLLLLMPITLGMGARGRWPGWIARNRRALQAAGLAATAALVVAVAWGEAGLLLRSLGQTVTIALTFSVLTMLTGWFVGRTLSHAPADHFTVLIQFSTRNLAIATVVAATLLGRPEFAVVAVAFFIVQPAVALTMVGLFRLRESTRRSAASSVPTSPVAMAPPPGRRP